MAAAEMEADHCQDDNQVTPKAGLKSTSVRLDWASMQSSLSDDNQIEDRFDEQRALPSRPTTPTPGSSKRKRSTLSDPTNPSELPLKGKLHPSTRVYDIPTLMKYRTSLAGLTVFAKIKPEALNGTR